MKKSIAIGLAAMLMSSAAFPLEGTQQRLPAPTTKSVSKVKGVRKNLTGEQIVAGTALLAGVAVIVVAVANDDDGGFVPSSP